MGGVGAIDPARAWDGPLEPSGSGPAQFDVEVDGATISGERLGEGSPVIMLHGLTAGRRFVVHGSRVVPRAGYTAIAYDARGHGRSDGLEDMQIYGYPRLASDLDAVLIDQVGERRAVLAGHSMGAHSAIAFALDHAERVAGLVLIGPASLGTPPAPESVEYWEGLADALESGGVEGFLRRLGQDYDDEWRDRVLGFTRDRMSVHRDLGQVAKALREIPLSLPFEGTAELESLDVPALVVASRDDADPGHPLAVAEEWAGRLPSARLVSEGEGASPLAWQGGRLSREIVSFCGEPAVAERLAG